MPKRVIDFDAMWGSDKIASCAEWAQAEYAWLYGLADPSGCFELTNLRVIWGRVAAIRRNLTIERLEQVFGEFRDKGLLFVWEHEGKLYGHWTGSDVPGRLPPPSWRMRLERLAPPVPKQRLAEYMSGFARGRAGLPGGGFAKGAGGEQSNLKFEISDLRKSGERRGGEMDPRVEETARAAGGGNGGLKGEVDEGQGQDLDLGLDWESEGDEELVGQGQGAAAGRAPANAQIPFSDVKSNSKANSASQAQTKTKANSQGISKSQYEFSSNAQSNSNTLLGATSKSESNSISSGQYAALEKASAGKPRIAHAVKEKNAAVSDTSAGTAGLAHRKMEPGLQAGHSGNDATSCLGAWAGAAGQALPGGGYRDKWEQTARELRVGQGPVCGPVRVRPEALERIRLRNAGGGGSGSP